jgi:hypothetical protein
VKTSIRVAAIAWALGVGSAGAQTRPTGNVSLFADHFPERDASELRARVFAEDTFEPGAAVHIRLAGFAEGLFADRGMRVTAAVAEPQDASVEWRLARADVTAGFTRVAWGRLDEVQPTDVVNPLDASRFLFDGRAEARLAVPLVRARIFAGDRGSIEAIWVPVFRRGTFDRLDEESSPFNLGPDVDAIERREPPRTIGNSQGGARLNLTTGRVDWSVSAYRGFRPFGAYGSALGPGGPTVTQVFPRFTMIGGDFESVAGAWAFRGEAAAFVEDGFQVQNVPGVTPGRSFDAGGGVDRRAGAYRVSGSVLLHLERYDTPPIPLTVPERRTDVSLIASTDRRFAHEKYQTRVFAVYSPSNGTGFLRGIGTMSLRDNLALEGSIGRFAGIGVDTIGRFGDSDFLYARLKYYF